MVFESIVVELINRFAGDYVENLDTSQLKIGLWGGDVVLNNLDLKGSALDDLDLPIKIKTGHVDKVVLKIPWKNLYTEPVIVNIDGIYALAVPNVAIKYNEEKEEKERQDAKQKKLTQIEEAKKAEADKDKPQEVKKDSFAEKMITQIIKNLQINVSNIHVRYEDRFTDPNNPVSIGVSLSQLLFQTTDENWKPTILKDTVTQIYKLIRIDSLAVYWNSSSSLYEELDSAQITEKLKKDVATNDVIPDFKYLVNPISSVAHLKLHTKPEIDNFSIPKIFLTIVFDNIAVSLRKKQFDDVLQLLESFERMNLVSLYRKYRPDVPRKGNAKVWWHYAYKCVLEETVRRRRKMWSWDVIKKHRDTLRAYREAYVKKLTSKSVPKATASILEDCEKTLDVFNITVMRQQAEVMAAKEKQKAAENKTGWFGGLFGGNKSAQKKDPASIENQFYDAYTSEEKDKLYAAIGYQENEADPTLPSEFVAVQLVTKLNAISVNLIDDSSAQGGDILRLQLSDLFASVGQRPAASAVKIDAKIDDLTVSGKKQGEIIPQIVTSQTKVADEVLPLVDAKVETKPDEFCEARISLNARPLQIIYDAITINHLAEFFKPPESVHLKQLSEAAMARLDDIKEQSNAGLQHAIAEHKYTDIKVDIKPVYVIVPYSGLYTEGCTMLLVDLGNLKVNTKKNTLDDDMANNSLETVMEKAYDVFNIQLQTIQALYVPQGVDWQSVRRQANSDLHILRPISIDVTIEKCMIVNDPKMPKLKVGGGLPLISVNMSDKRLQQILALVESIPFPEPTPEPDVPDVLMGPSTLPTAAADDTRLIKKIPGQPQETESQSSTKELVNLIDMQMKFEVKEVCVNLFQHKDDCDPVPMVKLVIDRVGASLQMRTFDMVADAYVGAIYVQYLQLNMTDCLAAQLGDSSAVEGGSIINLINTPVSGDTFKLVTLSFTQAKPDGPEFATKYEKVLQKVSVHLSMIEIVCHQTAILSLIQFAKSLQPPVKTESKAEIENVSKDENMNEERIVADAGDAVDKPVKQKSTKKKKEVDPQLVNMKLKVTLDSFGVILCDDHKLIMDVRIKGIDATIQLQDAKTAVSAMLRDMVVQDCDSATFYPKIVCIEGSEVLKANINIYNDGTAGNKYSDMSCVDTSVDVNIGQIKVFVIMKFINSILEYVSKFQVPPEAISTVGDSVAEYSRDAVSNITETASRILLNINMKAPLITIPQKSDSWNVLIVDLGQLSLQNQFELAGKLSPHGVPAVLDRMKIELYSLKFIRAVLTKDFSIQSDVELLEPISLKIQLCRNLSCAWYHDDPDIDANGSLGEIALGLTQSDLQLIMAILNENMTEGQAIQTDTPSSVTVTSSAGTVTSSTTSESKSSNTQNDIKPVTPAQAPLAVEETAYNKVKFDFKLRGLSLSLYNMESSELDTVPSHDSKYALARVSLTEFAVGGSMMSDTAIDVKVSLKDVILDDLIPDHQDGITRMVCRHATASNETKNLIDVSFTQDSNANKDIVVAIDSIYACLYLHFLMSVADVFVKGTQGPTAPPQPKEEKDKLTATVKKEPAVEERPTSALKVVLKLAKPDIILIEDPKKHDTNAIILETEVGLNVSITPDVMSVIGNISGFQLYSCIYNKRDSSKTQILPPTEVSLILKQTHGEGQHIDIQMTDVLLSVSPQIIRVVTAVLSGLSPPPVEDSVSSVSLVPEDLWSPKHVEQCDFWFLKTAPESAVEVQDSSSEATEVTEQIDLKDEDTQSKQDQLLITLSKIVLNLEASVGHTTVPMLYVETSFKASVFNWTSKLYVEASVDLEIAYYNDDLSVWEPLIEPLQHEGNTKKWSMDLHVMQNEDIPPEDIEDDADINELMPKMSIALRSEDVLNLTMTKSCMNLLTNLGKAFNDAYNLVPLADKVSVESSPFVFVNHTGIDMSLILDPIMQTPDNNTDRRLKLEPGARVGIIQDFTGTIQSVLSSQDQLTVKITVEIPQYKYTQEVNISRAKQSMFTVATDNSSDTRSLIVDVASMYGQKTISFQSAVQVKNECQLDMEVLYNSNNTLVSCGSVSPLETLHLPFQALYDSQGQLHVKPKDPAYKECIEAIKWKDMTDSTQLECPSSKSGLSSLFVNVKAAADSVYHENTRAKTSTTKTLHIFPSVVLHNLLPYPVTCVMEGSEENMEFEPGMNMALHHINVGSTNIEIQMKYQKRVWFAKRQITSKPPTLSKIVFESSDSDAKRLELGIHSNTDFGTMDLSLFCPYWMINKTGQPLMYQDSPTGTDAEVHTESKTESTDVTADYTSDITLFAFKEKSAFSSKQKESKETDKKDSPKKKNDNKKSDVKKLKRFKDTKFNEDKSFAIQIACCGRGENHFGDQNVESTVFRKLYPKTQLIGFFGSGEVGYDSLTDDKENEENRHYNIHRGMTTIFVLLSINS